jgi:hypothetical protein
MPVLRPLLAAAMLSALSADLLCATPLRITAGGTDLRAAPSDTAFVVAQALGGETLDVRGDPSAAWVSVVPPDRVSLWMYGDLVRNGAVIAPKVSVRAGPGINYEAVGDVTKGTQLVLRGSQGAWLEIAPPDGCLLWVRKGQVRDAPGGLSPAPVALVQESSPSTQVAVSAPVIPAPAENVRPPEPVRAANTSRVVRVQAPAAVVSATSVLPSTPRVANPQPALDRKPAAAAVPAVPRTEARPATPTVQPARQPVQQTAQQGAGVAAAHPRLPQSPAAQPVPPPPPPQPVPPPAVADVLPPGAEAVGSVLIEGVVRPRGIFFRYMDIPYRLVRRDEYDRALTVCVLQQGPKVDLSRFEDSPVHISGRQYLVKGWRYPLVVVEKINRLAAEPAPLRTPLQQ